MQRWRCVAAAIASQALLEVQSRWQPSEMAKLWLKMVYALTIVCAGLRFFFALLLERDA